MLTASFVPPIIHPKFLEISREEPKRSQKGAKKEPKKGAERKRAILEIVAENPTVTQAQLMEELNLTRKQVQKDMRELQEKGSLVREGTNRNGRWMIQKAKDGLAEPTEVCAPFQQI